MSNQTQRQPLFRPEPTPKTSHWEVWLKDPAKGTYFGEEHGDGTPRGVAWNGIAYTIKDAEDAKVYKRDNLFPVKFHTKEAAEGMLEKAAKNHIDLAGRPYYIPEIVPVWSEE